jgi:uncharacterized protein
MNEAALREALRQALAAVAAEGGGDAAHDLAHADRVWANCRAIAFGENAEPTPVLMAAAYLHDLVTLPKDHPDRPRASMLSAAAAGPVMEALGFAPRAVAAARHAIEAHSFSAGVEPLSAEAKILQDADRLEALGAIGIARCFAVSGELGRALFHAEDPFARGRTPDDRAFALDHFAVKLLKLPQSMRTGTGRKLAEGRADLMRRWLGALARELHAPPPGW